MIFKVVSCKAIIELATSSSETLFSSLKKKFQISCNNFLDGGHIIMFYFL